MLKVVREPRKVAGLLFLGVLFICFLIGNNTFADEASSSRKGRLRISVDTVLTVTAPETYNIQMQANDTTNTNTFTFSVSTNHVTGFTAYASVQDTDFVNVDDPTIVIPTIAANLPANTSNEKFPANHWAIRFWSSTDPEFRDNFVPASSSMVAGSYNSKITNYYIPVGIAARINGEIPSGHYGCTMTFQAVPNIVPDTIRSIDYLQEMNTEVAASMGDGSLYQLADARDGKRYWIRKENGRIYMAQNLDFEITDTIEGGVPVHTVLRPETSNVENETTLILTEPWGSTSSEIYYQGGNNVYYNGGVIPEDLDEIDPAGYDTMFSAGSYYSWSSATAGSGISINTADATATDSICPAGWRLPTSEEANLIRSPLSPVTRSGYFDSATSNILGTYDGINENSGASYYWTSETGSTANDIKYIYASSTTAEIREGDRNAGYSIRCVAIAPNEFTLTFDNAGGNGSPQDYHVVSWDESVSIDVSKVMDGAPTKPNLELVGWSTNPNATMPEYVYAGDQITLMPGEPVTVYAIWRKPCNSAATDIADAVCMQDINSTIAATMTTGQQYQLMDYRDGKNYWIAKLADGNVWMTQNLDLEISDTRTFLTSDDSDVTGTIAFSTSQSNIDYTDGGDFYYANGTTSTDTGSLNPTDTEWHYHAGSFYSWGAATTGVVSGYGEIGDYTIQSICPKGWTLPGFGDEVSSPVAGLMDITNAYNITDGTNYSITNSQTTAENSNGMLVFKADLDIANLRNSPIYMAQTGYVNSNGSLILPGSAGRFWTIKSDSQNGATALTIYSADSKSLLQKLTNENKNAQYSIRCVLK